MEISNNNVEQSELIQFYIYRIIGEYSNINLLLKQLRLINSADFTTYL